MQTRDASLQELMDAPDLDDAVLRRTLRDIRRINALLGWRRFAVREVARHVRARGLASFSLVDVACGSADIPLAIAGWARRRGIAARIIATDVHPQTLAVARGQTMAEAAIQIERQDALALPYADGSFDLALCTLALHHFAPDDAVRVLAELARVGRQVLVFDVVRSPVAYVAVLLLTRLARMGSMTRYDAPVSVRRAYMAAELGVLAARAGLTGAQIRVAFPYRLALVAPGRASGEHEP